MRILLITGSFPPMKCGVGDYTACLAKTLSSHKDVHVAVLTSEMNIRDDSDLFEVFPIIKKWKVIEFRKIKSMIRCWRPDIVHIQYPTQAYYEGGHLPLLLPALLSLSGIKVIQTWHEYYPSIFNLLELLKAIVPTPIVVVRPEYREHLTPLIRWLIHENRISFIPNASSLPRVFLTDQERREIHEQFAPLTKRLVINFGFFYPHKGTDILFDIADPEKHHLVLIGPFDETDPYHRSLKDRATGNDWKGSVTITGFLPPREAAKLLGAADAVVLPFRTSGGIWNTSLHGAALQGTFVMTTSRERQGYDAAANIYYAPLDDLALMRQALNVYAGRRNTEENIKSYATWDSISERHMRLYKSLLICT